MVIEEAYRSRRLATFAGEPVELVSIQVVGQGLRDGESVPERVRPSRPEPAPPPPRKAYFGAETGWLETPVLRRSDLSNTRCLGVPRSSRRDSEEVVDRSFSGAFGCAGIRDDAVA